MTTSPPDPQAIADRPVDLLAELESMARQSDDAAAACQAIYDRHYPEFRRLSAAEPATKENHERLLELYGHVSSNRDNAKRWSRDAEVLQAAVARLRKYETALCEISEVEDGAALRASLSTFPGDEALERYRKKLRELADDMVADTEFQIKEDLAANLAAWVEDLAKRALDALLRGNVEQMRRYLHCDGYTGRSVESNAQAAVHGFMRQREDHEWHPLIGGRLREADPIALRREIVEAHRDLITDQRILDLEDQVKSLIAQVNRRDNEIERLRVELRGFR